MFLSANSNTCVSSGLVQIDCLFFSLWIVFSCMPHNLSLNGERPPDIVNFTLLGSGRFLYSCNILRLCYQQSKITWKQSDPFESCIYEWSVYSPLLRQHLSEYFTHCSTNYESFPVWPVRTGTIVSCIVWARGTVSFPGLRQFPHMYTLINILPNTPGKPSADLRNSLYAALLNDILSANSSCFGSTLFHLLNLDSLLPFT